ncbi:MAG: hypothetical protein A3D52_00415 [Candidatus Taylorbacteria bacterium RIFCSPHIGHO2_02_FULL_44_36]|uniref:Polymerase beta nucleotidyltransferase domain-containing protein n=1 Tax=Candidatus Taylorbacteria bacterium RIFCSPLOWO2_12_FULL_44_15c TaxID=1802333 RepID=A0A1G2P7M5_9BACT|nr:MAG: hypothetical protein A3D52_00415 [Candidatus Taylorbacteria bacterium RIFCSPHIGHO2_02_FULL_44_36]OHA44354.1 MAG: hypothetical protein A3G03_00905 [Candidatus Taylorbacteria bacterium RIFCSPLOWO2_12_FULL_44_15c]
MVHLPPQLQDSLPKDLARIASLNLSREKHRLFFFGSRVDGTGNEQSDIDIGIDGNETIPEKSLAAIRNAVEALPTLFKIDIVDFTKAKPEFKTIALKHIEPIPF